MAVLQQGQQFPRFRFDTPYSPQNRFADLLGEKPLFLVFLSNLGHPVTRAVLMDYLDSFGELQGCNLACVVRSRPEVIAAAIPQGSLPYTLICDAEGQLYDYLEIPQEANPMKFNSLRAVKLMNEARKQGYQPQKGKPQQLPLTVLLSAEGEVLFVHYGKSLTDLPENCAAMQQVWEHLVPAKLAEEPEEEEPVADAAEEETASPAEAPAAPQEPSAMEPEPEEEPEAPNPFDNVLTAMKADLARQRAETVIPPRVQRPTHAELSRKFARLSSIFGGTDEDEDDED